MSDLHELEAQSVWDGSWYDLDTVKSHPVVRESQCVLKVVFKESNDTNEDFEELAASDIPKRIRLVSQPVQDSECGKLQPETPVVVLARWPDRDEQKYYNASIVSANRQQHSTGVGSCIRRFAMHPKEEGSCTCTFTVAFDKDTRPLAWEQGHNSEPPAEDTVGIEDICFPGLPADHHTMVLCWLEGIKRKQQELDKPQNSFTRSAHHIAENDGEAGHNMCERVVQERHASDDGKAGVAAVQHTHTASSSHAVAENAEAEAIEAAAGTQAAGSGQAHAASAAAHPSDETLQQQQQQQQPKAGQKRAGQSPEPDVSDAKRRCGPMLARGSSPLGHQHSLPQQQDTCQQPIGVVPLVQHPHAGVPVSAPSSPASGLQPCNDPKALSLGAVQPAAAAAATSVAADGQAAQPSPRASKQTGSRSAPLQAPAHPKGATAAGATVMDVQRSAQLQSASTAVAHAGIRVPTFRQPATAPSLLDVPDSEAGVAEGGGPHGRQVIGMLATRAAAQPSTGRAAQTQSASAEAVDDGEPVSPFEINHDVARRIPSYATAAQCRYFLDNMQGKPTTVYPGQRQGFPRSWFVLERTRTSGVSQGCKDRYFLSPEGKVFRTRGEAQQAVQQVQQTQHSEGMSRFNLLVDAAAGGADISSPASRQMTTRLQRDQQGQRAEAAARQTAAQTARALSPNLSEALATAEATLAKHQLTALQEETTVPLRLSDIAAVAGFQAQGTLCLLPSAQQALLNAGAQLTQQYVTNGTLTAATGAEMQASLAVLLDVGDKVEWPKGTLTTSRHSVVQRNSGLGTGAHEREAEQAAQPLAGTTAAGVSPLTAAGYTTRRLLEAAAAELRGCVQPADSPSPVDEDPLMKAVYDRVEPWSACSSSCINAYLGKLQIELQQLQRLQQSAHKAVAMVATAAAAAGKASTGTRPVHQPAAGIDPCVSQLVQQVFKAVLHNCRTGGLRQDHHHQQQRHNTAQGVGAAVLHVNAERALQVQALQLESQLDEATLVLQAEVASLTPYRRGTRLHGTVL